MPATPNESPWQERATDSVVAIKNGLETRYEGSLATLVTSAKALTLLTLGGAEVQVAAKRDLGGGWWEANVLRAAQATDAPRVGSSVRFHISQVLGGTL